MQKSKQIYNTFLALQDAEVTQNLKDLQIKICIVSIDKASKNFSFICKELYVSKLLDEIGLRVTQSDTYKLVSKLKDEVIDDNITISIKFDLEVQNDFKTHPKMYWLQRCTMLLLEQGLWLHLKIVAQKLCQRQLQKFLN